MWRADILLIYGYSGWIFGVLCIHIMIISLDLFIFQKINSPPPPKTNKQKNPTQNQQSNILTQYNTLVDSWIMLK